MRQQVCLGVGSAFSSVAVGWSAPPLCNAFSKGFPVKVGRGCGTSSPGASFIPKFQCLATKVHRLPALGSWPVATALRAGPSVQCLPVLSGLTLWALCPVSARAQRAHPVGHLLSVCPCSAGSPLWASPLVLAARNKAVTSVCSVPQWCRQGGLRGGPERPGQEDKEGFWKRRCLN